MLGIKAGSNIIDPTEEPVIEGEYSDTTGTYMVSRDKTAVFTAPAKASATSITIPDTIKVMNIKVKVVGIADNACKGMKKLAKLDIGQNVATIGANAFQGCAKLKAITVRTKHLTENSIGASAFKGIQKKATVTCPKGLAKTYQKIFVKKGMAKTVKFK